MKLLERKILLPGNRHFPICIPEYRPRHLMIIGTPSLFSHSKVALFSSIHCPGELLSKGYDLAQALRRYRITVMSGFHSPLEKEMLRIFLNGTQSILIGQARNISNLRIPAILKPPLLNGRLVFFSPFLSPEMRASSKTAMERNRLIAALAELIFIVSSSPGGKIEQLALEFQNSGRPVLAIKSKYNAHLEQQGIRCVKASMASLWLAEFGFELKTDLKDLPGLFQAISS
jgi:predicted Rossmann fold nucleotide-binding protein DprA/Smf involved in DNA uptake